MSPTVVGIAAGALLAVIGFTWGVGAFFLAALFMAVGGVIGRAVEGKVDLKGALDALTGRRSAS